MQDNSPVFRLFTVAAIGFTLLTHSLSAQESATKERPTATTPAVSPKQSAPTEKRPDDSNDESPRERPADDLDDSTSPRQPKISVAQITLRGAISEGPSQMGMFSGVDNHSLMSLLKRLDKAANDNKVRSVLLNIKTAGLGRGQLHEVRQAIREVRDSGKMVYAQMESGSSSEYLIACACDKIMMPESGTLMLPGIRAEVTFYKNLLDKLDVKADMLQVGDFKGAAEPMTRTEMSDAFRKQLESVLADYFDQMLDTIASDRSLGRGKVEELVDKGVFTAKDAKEAGLIDIVAYEDAWERELLAGSKDHELSMLEDYGKKKVDTNFSGMGGFIKMMELFSGGSKSRKKSKQAETIAVVYAVGAITSGESSSDPFSGGGSMGSDTIIEALGEADDDDGVAAIVLRVDSPGGSALASDLIWNKIETIDKPVIASMGNVAASGGYYISMGCDKIIAEPGTLTGSIGVVGGKMVVGGLMKKAGVTTDVISFGKNSDLFSSSEPFSKEGRAMMKKYMEETYKLFTEKAAAGREMKLEKLTSLAGGRVWTGKQALANGLVDELGSLSDAIEAAQEMAGLDVKETPDLLILPEQKTFFEEMLSGASATAPVSSKAALELIPHELRQQWADVRMLQQIFREPTACILPCRIEIR